MTASMTLAQILGTSTHLDAAVGPVSYYDAAFNAPVSRRDELAQIYSDMYKDAHGFRPRIDWRNMTEAELEAACDALQPEIEKSIEEERAAQDEAAKRFEARITQTIATGAGDRETAIRWIDQAEGADGDREYLCYLCGLRYGYFN
jgi:hypothetical protein